MASHDHPYPFIDRQIRHFGGIARHGINRYVSKYSEIGDPAVFEADAFEWASTLTTNWVRIRDEAVAVMSRDQLPSIVELSPDHGGINADGGWRSFFLWGYGFPIQEAIAACPETARLVENIPGLLTAMFSVHRPGTHLKRHRGVTKGIITIHLPLITPEAADRCRIEIEDHNHVWRPGEILIFDDTREHEVWNETTEPRVNLLLHIRRPLRFPGDIVQNMFFFALKRTAFVRVARANIERWSATLAER